MGFSITMTGKGAFLEVNLLDCIELNSKKGWEVGLKSLFTYHNLPNVDSHNNMVHYVEDGEEKHFEIPIGVYEFEDLRRHIENQFRRKISGKKVRTALVGPDFVSVDTKVISMKRVPIQEENEENDSQAVYLSVNTNTLKTKVVIMKTGLSLDFSKSNSIGPLLGFTTTKILNKVKHNYNSDSLINICGVSVVLVQCNLVTNSYINSKPAHTLHEFFPQVQPGYKICEVPTSRTYLPITERRITHVTVALTDQNSKLIDLRGEDLSVTLHFQEVAH